MLGAIVVGIVLLILWRVVGGMVPDKRQRQNVGVVLFLLYVVAAVAWSCGKNF